MSIEGEEKRIDLKVCCVCTRNVLLLVEKKKIDQVSSTNKRWVGMAEQLVLDMLRYTLFR